MASTSTDDNLPDPPGLPTEFCKAEGYPPILASIPSFYQTENAQVPPIRSALTGKKVDGPREPGSSQWVTAFNTTERDLLGIHPVQHGALVASLRGG